MADNFIQIGATRIKKSNIKQFGVSSEIIPEEPEGNGIITIGIKVVVAIIEGIYNKLKHGQFFSPNKPPKKTHRRYLYVTTYQNDNHKFYEDDIDIDHVVRQLESF